MTKNSAGYAGSQLFGGTVDNCHIPGVDEDIFYDLFTITKEDRDFSSISLNACFCNVNENPSCNDSNMSFKESYAGQEFNISIVTVGQYNGTVPGEVEYIGDETVRINNKPQHLNKTCSNVTLSVYSLKSGKVNITIEVKNQHANYQLNLNSLQITVYLKDTPLGFHLDNKTYSYTCVDKPNLAREGFECLINDSQAIIKRPSPKWPGHYVSPQDPNITGFIVYKHCPINYCYGDYVNIPTNHTFFSQDEQCANNRSGILCGQCRPGFSLSLGSLNCYKCTKHAILKTVGWSISFLFANLSTFH